MLSPDEWWQIPCIVDRNLQFWENHFHALAENVDGFVDSKLAIPGKNSKEFQQSNNKRVASCGAFYENLTRFDALKLKTVFNDDVYIKIKKWEGDGRKSKIEKKQAEDDGKII